MWNLSLDTVVVRGNTYSRAVRNRADGSFVWDMQMMDYLPKILGNADPLHYAQMLPGRLTEDQYKNQPMYSWEEVDFKTKEECMNYGNEHAEYGFE